MTHVRRLARLRPMLPWHSPDTWARLRRGEGCLLCGVEGLSDVVWESPTVRVRAPARACLAGYACVVLRRHVVELHDLPAAEAAAFVADVQRVSAAVQRITGAAKVNLLSLGNLVPHLHVHVCPRKPNDRFEGRPLDPGDVRDDAYAADEHAEFVRRIRRELDQASTGA